MTARVLLAAVAAITITAALPATASGALTGLSHPAATSVSDSAPDKSVTVTCPPGHQALTAGVELEPRTGEVLIDDIRPSSDLTSVTVRAFEDETGTTGNWALTARTVCSPPLPGLVRVIASSASSSAAKIQKAACPTGKQLLGTGAEVSGGSGQVVIDGVVPNPELTEVTVNAFEDQTGTALSWTLTAYAVCADPVAGVVRSESGFGSAVSDAKLLFDGCPGGHAIVGSGGEIDGGGGQVAITTLFARAPRSPGFGAAVDDTGFASAWDIRAYGICAPQVRRRTQVSFKSSDVKRFEVTCDSVERVTGVGGELEGALGEAWFNVLRPRSQFTFEIAAFDLAARLWSARAYVLCASEPAGYQRVAASGVGRIPFDTRTATAACPAGKKVLGVMVDQVGLDQNGQLQALAPSEDLQQARATLTEVEGSTDDSWTMTGHALCATPPPGLELVTATSEQDSEEIKTVTATCPAGKHLLGPGASVSPPAGEVVIDDLRPDAATTKVTVTGIEDSTGFDEDWTLRAFAVCASR